jgi:hypothetical protein
MNLVFYFILFLFFLVLVKGLLVVDEEIILIISVLIFLGGSYNSVSGFVVSGLADRAENIKKFFENFFLLKMNVVSILLSTYQKVYDTNSDIVKIIGVVANQLEVIRESRNSEVEYFLNFVVNNQLNTIATEEIHLLRSLFYNKVKLFFSNLLKGWKLYEIRGLVKSSEDTFNIFDDFVQSSKIINQNKLALLPLSSVATSDLALLSNLAKIKSVLCLMFIAADFLISYILVNTLLGLKVTIKV